MRIQRSYKQRGRWINESVSKVSEGELNDSIFFESRDEFIGLRAKVNQLLANKGLAIANYIQDCKNGVVRTFIGEIDYETPQTELA